MTDCTALYLSAPVLRETKYWQIREPHFHKKWQGTAATFLQSPKEGRRPGLSCITGLGPGCDAEVTHKHGHGSRSQCEHPHAWSPRYIQQHPPQTNWAMATAALSSHASLFMILVYELFINYFTFLSSCMSIFNIQYMAYLSNVSSWQKYKQPKARAGHHPLFLAQSPMWKLEHLVKGENECIVQKYLFYANVTKYDFCFETKTLICYIHFLRKYIIQCNCGHK